MSQYEVWKQEGENVLRRAGETDARSPEEAAEKVARVMQEGVADSSTTGPNGIYKIIAASNITTCEITAEPDVKYTIKSSRTPRARNQREAVEA